MQSFVQQFVCRKPHAVVNDASPSLLQGVQAHAVSLVSCNECRGQSLAHRYMSRCGANGFGKHSGLSSESVWRAVFKVDLPGVLCLYSHHVMHLHCCCCTDGVVLLSMLDDALQHHCSISIGLHDYRLARLQSALSFVNSAS